MVVPSVERRWAEGISCHPKEAFFVALCKRRRRLGLTQQRLADIADLTATAVAMVERGERALNLDTAARLCRALDVAAGSLQKCRSDLNTRNRGQVPLTSPQLKHPDQAGPRRPICLYGAGGELSSVAEWFPRAVRTLSGKKDNIRVTNSAAARIVALPDLKVQMDTG